VGVVLDGKWWFWFKKRLVPDARDSAICACTTVHTVLPNKLHILNIAD